MLRKSRLRQKMVFFLKKRVSYEGFKIIIITIIIIIIIIIIVIITIIIIIIAIIVIIISDQGFLLLEIRYENLEVNSERSYSNLSCLLSPIVSFSLFQSNVLCPFLQFMNAFINLESADTCVPYLKKF